MTVTLVPLVSNYEKLVETRGGGNSGDRRVEGGLVAADPRRTAPSPLGWCSRAQLFERASVRELERVHPASRRNTRETCIGYQRPRPCGVGKPRWLSAAAMPLRVVIPATRSSVMTGASSAARATARAWRARMPAWRIFELNDMREPYRAAVLAT